MRFCRAARGIASAWVLGVTMVVAFFVIARNPEDFRGLDDE